MTIKARPDKNIIRNFAIINTSASPYKNLQTMGLALSTDNVTDSFINCVYAPARGFTYYNNGQSLLTQLRLFFTFLVEWY